ncbi:hypothetical protein V5O48_012087 [Marasmius crinis-equi]|uniref:Uncharacterized protein n=1 Tax=Marasmius crinis-equi TaxID=585013 RepID=A0ABR3F3S2_9AGAR
MSIQQQRPLRVFLLAQPRTRSNLLIQLLGSHPSIVEQQYPFSNAYHFGPERQFSRDIDLGSTGKLEDYTEETYQHAFDEFNGFLKKTEDEKRIPLIKEHVFYMMHAQTTYERLNQKVPNPRNRPPVEPGPHETASTNLTLLPDEFLLSFTPVFIIRHPARAFPSSLRAHSRSTGGNVFDADFPANATFRFPRELLDWYNTHRERSSRAPVVIDGDKLVNDTKGQMKSLCEGLGINEDGIQYSWESKEDHGWGKVWDAYYEGIQNSTGVVRTKETLKPPVLEEEVKKWSKEWNEDVAAKLKELVESAMEDYEYLLTSIDIKEQCLNGQVAGSMGKEGPEPSAQPLHRPIFVFSHLRTRSNLLAHLLETHPEIGDMILYPIRAAHSSGPERRVKDSSMYATKEVNALHTFQNCYDEMQAKISAVYEKASAFFGKIPLIKEHAYVAMSASVMNSVFPDTVNETRPVIVDKNAVFSPEKVSSVPNPMVLPDSFLTTVTPILVIRPPVRVITSGMRVILNEYGCGMDEPGVYQTCTFKWTRILFEYYRARGITPIVVDGDELARDTESQMSKLCSLIGVDGSKIRYEWKPKASYIKMDETMQEQVYLKVLYESTGVIKDEDKLKPPNLDDEARSWVNEWGEDVARKLKSLAEKAMEDYEYLLQFRL